MSIFGRAVRGAEAGAVAAGGVALSFFVLDLIRLQPLATPGALSGAVFGPAGVQWDFTSMSGLIAGFSAAYRIATFTGVHFLAFALIGVVASLLFDWKNEVGLTPVLAVAVLCVLAFSATIAGSGSVLVLDSVGPAAVVSVNLFAAILLVGYLRLAHMPEPEVAPPD